MRKIVASLAQVYRLGDRGLASLAQRYKLGVMTTPHRFRRLQFRISTLLLVITAFCIWLGWETYAVRERRAALREISNNRAFQVTTAEAYALGWKSEYHWTEANYLFGRVDWRKDRFSGYDQQLSETIGYGRRLIDTGTHVLNAEIGAGLRQSDLADGTSEDEAILRAGIDYLWQFSETAQFTQVLAVESGSENTYLESVSALTARLVGSLAMVASYTIRNNSDVPLGLEKTDTFTALSLEYTF